ncbi:MAG: transglutaminase domain-containing protein [Clostridia bacterium]|nr:transglutaminase domain-containing protein [Clostridia bacterium]
MKISLDKRFSRGNPAGFQGNAAQPGGTFRQKDGRQDFSDTPQRGGGSLKLAGRLSALALGLVLSASLAAGWAAAASIPVKVPVQSGVTVFSNAKAAVDASNLAEGFVSVKYTGGKQVKIKVQITRDKSSATYTYNLNSSGTPETFPLTEGDGTYSVKVFENTAGDKYAQAYACSVAMTLRSEFSPFLYANQYVNFTSGSKVAAKAAELVNGKSSDLDKVGAVFDYVVDHFTYDTELARTVKSGYLPNVDQALENQKGICFDYAAVMSAMLRSQDIPCKLVVGYAGTTYHAWINVYLSGTGWVDKVIYFDGVSWTLMDPTFVSSGKRSDSIMNYVTTSSNYAQKYAY